MEKQILLIRGGEVFKTHGEYVDYLVGKKITLVDLKRKDWKRSLGEVLGDDYSVILPQMPNDKNARYAEWKIWFEKIVPLMESELILIGTSLGGIFLAKYLSENKINKKIKAVFLVAPPFSNESDGPLVDFVLTNDLSELSAQCAKIFIYQSKDDEVVLFADAEKYMKFLPNATLRLFTDRGHFSQPELSEIIEDIRSLE